MLTLWSWKLEWIIVIPATPGRAELFPPVRRLGSAARPARWVSSATPSPAPGPRVHFFSSPALLPRCFVKADYS